MYLHEKIGSLPCCIPELLTETKNFLPILEKFWKWLGLVIISIDKVCNWTISRCKHVLNAKSGNWTNTTPDIHENILSQSNNFAILGRNLALEAGYII